LLHPLSRRRLIASVAAMSTAASAPFAVARLAQARQDDQLPATARLNGWLETRFDFWLARSPMQQSYLGLKTAAHRWDDVSEVHRRDDNERLQRELTDLNENFHADTLSADGRMSLRLYAHRCQTLIDDFKWRHHHYPLSQIEGWQQRIPAFLMNIHHVERMEDAQAYIARLNGIGHLVDQIMDLMRLSENAGVLAPKFAYANVLRDCRNLLEGAPFTQANKESPLWVDISRKIDALNLDAAVKQRLRAEAIRALITVVRPAYLRLMDLCQRQGERANTDDGAWKHPDGEAYYASRLAHHTTTDRTAGEIHAFGLSEVARIQGEIQAAMTKVGFRGDLQAFFTHLENDPQFYYPQTTEGKAAYMARVAEVIAAMNARLGESFLRRPGSPLVVKSVEAFREQSATSAFYQSPGAFDGRPGTYYINTFDMRALPKFEMEALAYHEAIPGHHLQIALAQEMSQLPRFRRFSSYTAYDEGWGLYSERLAKDMGFYQNAYSDIGRLSSELWRACRLVVDTGIHMDDKRWTREQAVAYLMQNTPNTAGDIQNSVERYIVDPGQATAYKIGMAKILELRELARADLGGKFDLRAFHEAVLGNASLPLTVLGDVVREWIKETA